MSCVPVINEVDRSTICAVPIRLVNELTDLRCLGFLANLATVVAVM